MESTQKKDKQKIQDAEYSFPYHYIARFSPDFSQCVIFTWGINYAATIELLLEKLSNNRFNSIVDVGCGDGRFTSELSQLFPNKRVVGIDYSEKAINLAKAMNPIIPFFTIDITKEKHPEKFDVVVLMEVLEHIPLDEVNDFIKSISDLLFDEGLLFITVPHRNKPLEDKHFQHFSIESLSNQIRDFFMPCETIPFERICLKKQLIDNLLINRFFILNNKFFLNCLYAYYKKRLFFVPDERNCQRIFLIAKKI
jgi:2-polyprenyl-3-methyl-5-hydroxy-6-metoxy-1,4-benzoquinol methylase